MKIVSLFSGAMGLDLGLESAGHEVVVAVESDPNAIATIRKNRPDLPVIARPIESVTTEEILKLAGLAPGTNFIVAGGPCCQAFSTVGKRESLGDPRGNLFLQFVRVVREAQPAFFLMENVRGIFSAAERHRPLNQRGPEFPSLADDELLGSAFARVASELRKLRYYTIFDLLNAANYGTPQKRERFVALGSRDGHALSMPAPSHSDEAAEGLNGWVTLREALKGVDPKAQRWEQLGLVQQRLLPLIPPGGDWRVLPVDLQREALGSAFDSWGGRTGFMRRLAWDRPSPSLVTTPTSRATMLAHPKYNRPLSTEEYARIQEFPKDWVFTGVTREVYRQIGNAVPVGLGRALGEAISKAQRSKRRVSERGIFCFNEQLLARLTKRPSTVADPTKLRMDRGQKNPTQWVKESPKNRAFSLRQINVPIGKRAKSLAPRLRSTIPSHTVGSRTIRRTDSRKASSST